MPTNPAKKKPSIDGLGKAKARPVKPIIKPLESAEDDNFIIEDPADEAETAQEVKPEIAESAPEPGEKTPAKKSLRQKLRRLVHNKWFWIVLGVLVVLIAVAIYFWPTQVKNITRTLTTAKTAKKVVAPTTVADPLTGLAVTSTAARQPIVGVMIENLYPDARPQSGLGQAGVVYEALAEGGITRFLSIFQEPLPISIGPVRSLRPYYLDWGLEYNIPVAHAGGSEPALANIGPLHLKNIEALVYDGSYFYRTSDRYAPHNLYTNADKLTALVQTLGFAAAPSFTPIGRKKDAPETTPTHPTITLNFSTSAYAVKYTYDAPTNSYARVLAGTPHIDRNTGKQIFVKNVVALEIPTTYGTQQDGKPETDYALTGSGTALVFTDGGVTLATWSKASDAAQTKLTDATGAPIKLNAGNTWFEAIPAGSVVTY